jgi:hypothetical protein
MKKLILTLALIPYSISAQQYPDMSMGNQAEMKIMMAVMQKMQACMQKIDKKELKILENKGKVFEKEIQVLCNKGEREQAQQKTKETFQAMMKDPITIKLKKCTDIMQDISSEISINDSHVCDSPKEVLQ